MLNPGNFACKPGGDGYNARAMEDTNENDAPREAAEGAEETRQMGEQPLAARMRERGLSNHDLVAASARPITHKLVMRAARGRRLTIHSKELVLAAFNRATGGSYRVSDLFDY